MEGMLACVGPFFFLQRCWSTSATEDSGTRIRRVFSEWPHVPRVVMACLTTLVPLRWGNWSTVATVGSSFTKG